MSNDEVMDDSVPNEVLENIFPSVLRIPGCMYEISDTEIIALGNSDDAEDEDSETIRPQKITHNEGVKAFEQPFSTSSSRRSGLLTL